MFQVSLMDDKRVVCKEYFRDYYCAMAFFDSNCKRYTVELRDLRSNWRYKAS